MDLRKIVEKGFILPHYFYLIKDIAKSSFLNFKWRHQKAGGGQSVFWYERWLETGDSAILEDIIDYNEDDVRATEKFYKYVVQKKNTAEDMATSRDRCIKILVESRESI